MTNYTDNTLDDCSADELLFWGFPAEAPEPFEDSSPIVYDLEERTSRFGEQIILFAKKISWSPVNNRLIDQLVGAGTSVGANYCEADDGISRPDFRHRISICRKEARESKFSCAWFRPLNPALSPKLVNSGKKPTLFTSFQPHLAQYQTLISATQFVIRYSSFPNESLDQKW